MYFSSWSSQYYCFFFSFYFACLFSFFFFFFFFFQAEDGIRDLYVTGVQTCALPISAEAEPLVRAPWPAPSSRISALACTWYPPTAALRPAIASAARWPPRDRKSVV